MDSRFDHWKPAPAPPVNLPFFRLSTGARLPMKAHSTDTGFDLFLDDTHVFEAGETQLAHTGVGVTNKIGEWGLILGRSSSLYKHGLLVYPGVIDQDYQGELLVSVYNTKNHPVVCEAGSRVAQFIPMVNVGMNREPVWSEPLAAGELKVPVRGSGSFGSSGK